jgi:hypothetical protein
MLMHRETETVSDELQAVARGRDERTPLYVLVLVALAVFFIAGAVTLAALLVYWLG